LSAKTHPRAIGAFVLGSTALVLGAIVLLSSGNWFARRDRFTVFFPGSVRGLNQGAPLTFRGVKVGEVVDVRAFLTGRPDPVIQIEVVIEIRGDVVEVPPGMPRPFAAAAGPEELAKELIDRGIRATMMSASLLTGQRYIDLDFRPEAPARFAGLHPRYPELPTTPGGLEKLGDRAEEFMKKLAELPLDQMLEDVRQAISAARSLLESPDVREVFVTANRSAKNFDSVLVEARTTLAAAEKTLTTLDGEASLTAGEARQTLQGIRDSLVQAERSLTTLDATLRGTDDARVAAMQALDEMNRTLRALRNLVDYIQTHPEAVVLGKQQAKERR
jgi:paraquat-inducible protein B